MFFLTFTVLIKKTYTMKTLTLLFALIFSITFSYAQNKGQNITVTVNNVLNNKGKVIFSLHTENTFMKSQSLQSDESIIENGKAKVTFKNVEPGTYAIMVLHDENDNKRMDFEVNGMPKENYGMSNNPVSYGPPQFTDAKFSFESEDLDLLIRF